MTKPLPSTERPDVDWPKAKVTYAQTTRNLRQMAQALNTSLRSVQRHSAEDKWAAERATYRHRVSEAAGEKAVQKASDTLAESIVTIRNQEEHLAQTLIAALQAALDLTVGQLAALQQSQDPRPFDDLLAVLELAAPIVSEIRKSTAGPAPQSADALVASLQRLTTTDRVDIYKASIHT